MMSKIVFGFLASAPFLGTVAGVPVSVQPNALPALMLELAPAASAAQPALPAPVAAPIAAPSAAVRLGPGLPG